MSTPQPVTPPLTFEQRLAALEAKARAEEAKVSTWLKTEWPHFVTWIGVAWVTFKHWL